MYMRITTMYMYAWSADIFQLCFVICLDDGNWMVAETLVNNLYLNDG